MIEVSGRGSREKSWADADLTSDLCPSLAGHVTSLDLGFLIRKIRIIPTSYGSAGEDQNKSFMNVFNKDYNYN